MIPFNGEIEDGNSTFLLNTNDVSQRRQFSVRTKENIADMQIFCLNPEAMLCWRDIFVIHPEIVLKDIISRCSFQVRGISNNSKGVPISRLNDLFIAMFIDKRQIIDMVAFTNERVRHLFVFVFTRCGVIRINQVTHVGCLLC